MKTIEEIIERNKEVFIKLDEYLNSHDDVGQIVTSSELKYLFAQHPNGNKDEGEYSTKYKGIRVLVDCYSPTGKVSFIHKNTRLEFELPCNCGCWPEDKCHGEQLR